MLMMKTSMEIIIPTGEVQQEVQQAAKPPIWKKHGLFARVHELNASISAQDKIF